MSTFYIFIIAVWVTSSCANGTTVCKDNKELCHEWAKHGLCRDNPTIARRICKKSCATCSSGSTDINVAGQDCDCDYHPGGCSISKPAPSGMACHCVYKVLWMCYGRVSKCSNPDSPYCTHPDYSVASCLLGGGDCEGYKTATCDCDYSSGGCTISKVPPPNTACRCRYQILWKCYGSITNCKDANNYYCKNPDKSIYTCIMGSGDCGGY